MGETLLQKVLPKPLSKNFYYSFLIYGVLLHNPKLARRAREYKRVGSRSRFFDRRGNKREGERSIFTYVTEPESRSSPMYIGKDTSDLLAK